MKNAYTILKFLEKTINNNYYLVETILSKDKENFANNDEQISISIGIIKEIEYIVDDLDSNIFILNKELYDCLLTIMNYSKSIFNNYMFVNAYKLYDFLLLDLNDLKKMLNSFSKK